MTTQITKTCSYCKSNILAGASHCAHCGKNTSQLDRTANQLFTIGCPMMLVFGCLFFAILMIGGR